MTLKLTTILSIATIVLLTSCGKGEIDFNNTLVENQKEVLAKYNAFITKQSENEDVPADSTLIEAKSIITLLNIKIKEVNALNIPKGGEQLHKSFLKEFEFMRSYIDHYIIVADSTKTASEVDAANTWLGAHSDDITTIENELIEAQKQFAKDKNFKIQ